MKVLQVPTGQTSIHKFISKTLQMKEHSALGSGSPDIARALCRHKIFIPASRNALQHCQCKIAQFGNSVTAPTFSAGFHAPVSFFPQIFHLPKVEKQSGISQDSPPPICDKWTTKLNLDV